MSATLILVGGFLGSGKTTLLLAAAEKLREAGRRVALILNDQAGELVDTRLARAAGLDATEVAGGCFCCRFSDFIASAEQLLASDPEFIFAEPVGSCTDLSATVLQPLKRFYGDRFHVAPFTVLVDASRARKLLAPDADPQLSYLFRQQLGEADIVLLSKSDLYAEPLVLDGVKARPVSAQTGQGVAQWLEDVCSGTSVAGNTLLDIDYALYADAEAALGWLNWHAALRLKKALTPAAVAGPLLTQLDRLLTAANVDIVHLKVFVQASTGYLKASVCQNGEFPSIQGALDAPPALSHELVLNLRAKADPEQLTTALQTAVADLPGRVDVRYTTAFRPSPPQPEHRITKI